jgi:hypothetical protein
MADCYSNYLRDKINDHLHGGPDFVRPATTYFAPMTVVPIASGGGTEVSSNFGGRAAVTNNVGNWPASSGQSKTNGAAINFGNNTGGTVIIAGIAEYDASSSGNLLTFAALSTPLTVNNGGPLSIPVSGALYNWAT